MRALILTLLLGSTVAVWSQNSSSSSSSTPSSDSQQHPSSQPPASTNGSSAPRVDPAPISDESGDSSSKDSTVDISPPANDAQTHPRSSQALLDAEMSDNPGSNQVHPWDPHKAAKDIEVGDYYLKVRKNYRAAEDRYREALYYKENDAMATFGLAMCLEKLNEPDDARQEYQAYLKILPDGPESKNARKALARLKSSTENAAPGK